MFVDLLLENSVGDISILVARSCFYQFITKRQ